jgi:uncharacterized membrane protein
MDVLVLAKVAAVMLLLDGIWIYLVAGNAFSSVIENIQGSAMKIRPVGAVVAYAAMILLFSQFTTKESSGWDVFLLGFLVYAIYDGTNYALLDKYDLKTAIVDAVWGGCIFWMTSRLVYKSSNGLAALMKM